MRRTGQDGGRGKGLIARFIGVAIPCLLASCTREASDVSTFEVADSGGVRVVTSYSPQGFGTPWALTPEPILRIGKGLEEEPYLFGSIGGAARLGDGSIVVLDRLSSELHRFDAQGQHVVSFGGKGEGPGEFRSAMWLQRLGDTLVVFDRGGRVSRFDPNGRLLAEIPVGGLLAGDQAAPGDWSGVLADGVLWGVRSPRQEVRPTDRVYRPLSALVSADLARTEARRVTEYLGFADFQAGGGSWGFLPQFLTAVVSSRKPIGLLVGDNETFTIDLFDSGGTHLLRMKYPSGVSEEVRQHVEDERRRALAGFEAFAERQPQVDVTAYRRWLADLPVPEVWPGFGFLIADGEGYVWAAEYRTSDITGYVPVSPSDRPRPALVFHPDGHLLGSVDLPPRLLPWEIGADYVLGVEVDELGVNEVVLYGLKGRA
jgi:hypothetical protein